VQNGSPIALAPHMSMARNTTLTQSQRTSAIGERDRAAFAGRGVPRDRAMLMQATVEVRAALEDAAMAAAAAAQRARSLIFILEEAVAVLTATESGNAERLMSTVEVASRTDALSPREREVLALVAEGRSNKAIAEALFVSPNTVKTHVASLLHKLDADTRAQLAVIATRHAPSNSVPDALPAAPGSARISPSKTVGIAQLGG
jgi:DNA-binding CsgD family transcriptional regulator